MKLSLKGRKILTIVLTVVLVLGIVYLVQYYVRKGIASKKMEDLQSEVVTEIKKPTETSKVTESEEPVIIPIDFANLKHQNPDVYAWIAVENSEISYPILQNYESDDLYNDYYLDHNFDRSAGLPGCIYTERINSPDFSDPNTVIYGHELKAGTMFTRLHDYEDATYFAENPIIHIYTPEHIYEYEIYAAVNYSDSHLMKNFDYSKTQSYQRFLDSIIAAEGNHREGVAPTTEDKVITLSTCYAKQPTRRFLVVAVLRDIK